MGDRAYDVMGTGEIKVNCVGRVVNACESNLPLEETLRLQGASMSSKRCYCWEQEAG